jgi:ATP-dependent Clp protease adaptor protein ClpS
MPDMKSDGTPSSIPASSAPAPAAPEAKPAKPVIAPTPDAAKPAGIVDQLPPFRVLLHNDDHNDMQFVVDTLLDITPLEPTHCARVMLEAHTSGVALVLMTHQERAELYRDQFASKGLIVTIEPA